MILSLTNKAPSLPNRKCGIPELSGQSTQQVRYFAKTNCDSTPTAAAWWRDLYLFDRLGEIREPRIPFFLKGLTGRALLLSQEVEGLLYGIFVLERPEDRQLGASFCGKHGTR